MDITSWWPGGATRTDLLDVTIRCPHAERYRAASTSPGTAAAAGPTEKLARYGSAVEAISFESYGRLAAASTDALGRLAADARHAAGAEPRPARLEPRWRLAAERALAWATADVLLLAVARPRQDEGGGGGDY